MKKKTLILNIIIIYIILYNLNITQCQVYLEILLIYGIGDIFLNKP